MGASQLLRGVAVSVHSHDVNVGVAEQLVDHLVIGEMTGLWQSQSIGSFWRARETKPLVYNTYHDIICIRDRCG